MHMNNIVNNYAMFMQNLNLKNVICKIARKYSKYNTHYGRRIRQIFISLINTNFILYKHPVY